MAVGDLLTVTIVGRLHGQTTNYVLNYRETVTGMGNQSVELCAAIDLTIADKFRAWASDEWTYLYTQVQKFFPLPLTAYVVANGSAGSGAIAENSMPTEVAAVITKVSAFGGRDRRGRVFLAGVPETYELNSALSALGITNTTTLAGHLIGLVSDLGATWSWEPVIVSRKVSVVAVRWLASRVNPNLRAQRRRQIGKGI